MSGPGPHHESTAAKGDAPYPTGLHLRSSLWPGLAVTAVLAVTAGLLRAEGRRWWCACGQPFLWSGNVKSRHNSQHLLDPYSFTHILHGLVFYGLLAWACPRVPVLWRLFLAVCLAAAWEVIENSPIVIQRYRAETASLDYVGDSVANSLGDILCCAVGFVLARRLGFRWSVVLFLVTEGVLLLWIRDDLLLNVLMLVFPLRAIKAWQMGL